MIQAYLKKRWEMPEGKDLKKFFLDHINEGDEGYLKISEKWIDAKLYYPFYYISNHYRFELGSCLDLRYIDLQNNHFENALFSSFNLTGANISGCTFKNTQFAGVLLEAVAMDHVTITGSNSIWLVISDSDIKKLDVKDHEFIHLYVINTNIVSSKIAGKMITSSYFVDITFTNSELQNINIDFFSHKSGEQNFFKRETTKKILFDNVKMSNVKIKLDGGWDNFTILNSKLSNLSIIQHLGGFSIQELPPLAHITKFENSAIDGLKFHDVYLSDADFSGSSLKDVHFVNSKLDGIKFSLDKIESIMFENTFLNGNFEHKKVFDHNTPITFI
jgi:uncharacterized protein YjbI with pentapeptide repeats